MELTNEELATLGLHTDEYGCQFYEKSGCCWDSVSDYIWCDLMGFCGCGDMGKELDAILELMQLIVERKNNDEAYKKICDENKPYQIYLYILDRFGLTEHGFSIFGSWLTPLGEVVLKVLKSEKDKEGEEYADKT